MSTSRMTAAILALSIAFPGVAGAAKKGKAVATPCVTSATMPSLNVYTVKTELMTAALSCGERERYNQFVGMREGELVQHSQTMKKALGSRTNSFVTKVANITGGKLDCAEASGHFDQALSPEMQSLETISSTEWAQARHGYAVCAVKKPKKVAVR